MATKALGKGLEALIPGWNEQSKKQNSNSEKIEHVLLERINPSLHQPRKTFNEEGLQELSNSIKSKGIIQPLVVVLAKKGFELIAGERRYRASKMAGLKKVPVIVKKYKEDEKFEISLLENLQREDLNPIEEALSYSYLVTKFDLSQEELAKRVNKKRSSVANAIRLLALPEKIQQEIKNGGISAGQARTLLSIPSNEERLKLIDIIKNEGISVRALEKIVKDKKGKSSKSNTEIRNEKEAEILQLEEKLMHTFGAKVTIDSKGQGKRIKGTIKIGFASLDDLERIISIIK